MAKTKIMSKHKNHGDGCSTLRMMASDNGRGAPWSDPNHDVLFSVMMQLEIVDLFPFSGVCKSWRSLALSNKSRFMASRPPMAISICSKLEYRLEDSEGRKSKMILPQFAGRSCIGLTCGYLVLYGKETCDFWLVNPITRHGIHFPRIPWQYPDGDVDRKGVRAILVFSHSTSAWVFLVLCRCVNIIWFSIAGEGVWNRVSSEFPIHDLHDFEGKIYVIDDHSVLYELDINPEPKLTLLKTKNHPESWDRYMPSRFLEFVCSGENLYAIECFSSTVYEVHKLDFGEMKWVSAHEKTMEEYAFFVSKLKHSAVIKRELLTDYWPRYKKYAYSDTSRNPMFFTANIWYFAHDCLKVDLKHK